MIGRNWFDADVSKEEVAQLLHACVSAIDAKTYDRRWQNLLYAKLASGRDLQNIYGLQLSSGSSGSMTFGSGIAEYEASSTGVVAEALETLTSRVGKNYPGVTVLTDRGDYMQRRQGRALSKFWDGLAEQNSLRAWLPEVFADMLRWGLGVIHASSVGSSIKLERVIADELRIDPADAMMGLRDCKRLYRVRFAAKSVLVARYPEHKDEIWASASAYPGAMAGAAGLTSVESPEQWGVVIEGYSRGTAENPGRRTVIIGSTVVVEDDKKFVDSIPYAFFPAYPTGTSPWPCGIVEQMVPYVSRANKIARSIADATNRVGNPKWMVPKGAKVNPAALSNKVAVHVVYEGPTPPTCVTPPPVSQEMLSQLDWWLNAARTRVGVNQMASAGKNPLGAGASGAALDAYDDQASARHSYLGSRLEEGLVDLAKIVFEIGSKVKPSVRSPGRYGVQQIKWDRVNVKDPVFKATPISSYPSTPSGRDKAAKERLDAGLITREEYFRVVSGGDIDAISDPIEASRDLIEHMLDSITEEDVYIEPEKYMDLQEALRLGNARYCRHRDMGAPDSVLSDLARWIEAVEALMPKAAPAPTPELPATASLAPVALPASAAS